MQLLSQFEQILFTCYVKNAMHYGAYYFANSTIILS